MPHLKQEEADLARADADIAAGTQRIAKQEQEVKRLRRKGRDTAVAERMLTLYKQTLAAWTDHRKLTIDRIAEVRSSRRR